MLVTALAGFGDVAIAAPPEDVPLTLTGCVIAGHDKDSYMLTNVTIDGTTAAPSNAFYRFNTSKGLKQHVGHRVEVTGKADLADVDKGKVRVKTDDGKATTAVSSERRTVEVDQNVWAGSMGALDVKDMKADVATYRFNVAGIKRLQGNCTSANVAQ
jgi:hypothetical protein